MADYTLSGVHTKLNQLVDKVNGDYFPMPVFLNFFEMEAYDFIGAEIKEIELNQSITDNVQSLVKVRDLVVAPSTSPHQKYSAGVPDDYYRTLAHTLVYNDGIEALRSDMVKHAEYQLNKRNPNRQPTKNYPAVLQHESTFEIDAGPAVPVTLRLTYCAKPLFARTDQSTTRIVNLPDDVIDKILKKTVTALFNTTADPRFQSSKILEDEYQKIFN